MNERIKELEQQCWEVRQYNPPWFNATKFAELIMREFIGILEEEIKLVEEFKSTSVKADVIKCHQSKNGMCTWRNRWLSSFLYGIALSKYIRG